MLNFCDSPNELTKLIMSDELASITDPKAKDLIRTAIKLASTVDKKNTYLFFSRLRREKNYLFCCMMLRFLNNKRQELVQMLS